jgi:hypothetical protein
MPVMSCDVPADDEGLDCFRALEGVDGLDVGHVPDDVEVEQDAYTSKYPCAFRFSSRYAHVTARHQGLSVLVFVLLA